MTREHLKPKDLSKRPDHLAISAKGGRSRTPTKTLASRINGLLSSKKLAPEQKYMLALLRDRRFVDLILELISMSLEEVHNSKRRDRVIEQLSRFLPTKTINLDLSTEDPIPLTDKNFIQFKDAVFQHCDSQTLAKIAEDLKND